MTTGDIIDSYLQNDELCVRLGINPELNSSDYDNEIVRLLYQVAADCYGLAKEHCKLRINNLDGTNYDE